MSKFIRTKDGIIYVGDLVKDEQGNYCDPKDYDTIEVSAEYIIKEADTIDELCDGFYIDDGQEFCPEDTFTNFDKFKDSYEYYNKYCVGKYDGYGFIKTPKGLIYVAKMNENGELELI